MRNLKKLVSFMIAAMLSVCIFAAPAFAEEDFAFELHADGKGYVLTAYNGHASSVTVPDWYNNLPVVAIGASAFQDNTAITKVSLPSTITVIGVAAFKNCTSLSAMSSYEASGEPPVLTRIPGDADGDGMATVMDALMILQYNVGWDVSPNLENSDVDGSGAVDVMDALLILQYNVGWDVELV